MNDAVSDLFLSEGRLEHLKKYLIEKKFRDGDVLFHQNDSDGDCYYLLEGNVATSYYDEDLCISVKLNLHEPGEILGAVAVITEENSSLTAIAEDDVTTLFLSSEKLKEISLVDPLAHQEFLRLANESLIKRYRQNETIIKCDAINKVNIPAIDEQVVLANQAHQDFINWPEKKVDQIIQTISQTIYDHAPELAARTREESGMGVTDHKILKIKLGSLDVAESLVSKPGNGILELEANGVEKMTMPVGVVFGMIPITNPVETIVFKTLISLKSRNAIIISSHRKGRSVGEYTVNLIRDVLKSFGAPENLVQTPALAASRKVTNAYMSHPGMSMILATGGPSMVKSAYSSGTPAIGVGKGNAPVWICDDCDVAEAAAKVVNSKSFDNGVVCGSENNLIIDQNIGSEFFRAAQDSGAAVLTEEECEQLLKRVFVNHGRIAAHLIGQSAEEICKEAGIERDYPVKLIMAPVDAYNFSSPLVREKLAPILSAIVVESDTSALDHVFEILELEGKGHTAIIHSNDRRRINEFSVVAQVSRVLVSSAGTQGCIGAENGLNLSWTLGCGTLGGGSVSDNVSYQHLQNTKRIAY